ncbi:MAG: 23S rRNA (adenine(2503)-C(2))-methyltransferase RlmN [Clostridia bacterium]|nr:23S rRNA (adenine(2503)-C(2))-methyltransferase RlmN [Clostridia bacterium]
MQNIKDLDIAELENKLIELGEKKYRAKQIFKWVHQGVRSFDDMTDLSMTLRDKLKKEFDLCIYTIIDKQVSKDGTKKYLFQLADKNTIETVLMKYKYGNSICVSSQIGCKMGCKFCASSKVKFIRSLTSGEIVEQLLAVTYDIGERISNVVFMGIGEPFDNYDNVLKAIHIINNPHGLNIGGRHISVSTCGIVPKILQFAEEGIQSTLSISLHAPNDNIRKSMMPIAERYSINELIDACKKYTEKTNRRITFEYSLVNGVNDTQKDANELANLLHGILCHVNLIPVNSIKNGVYTKSSDERIQKFRDILDKRRITATVRRELGSDIEAACGQLRRDRLKEDII